MNLIQTLRSLGIEATSHGTVNGPTVDQHALTLDGSSVRKLEAVSRDLAVALGQSDVRILAPIPGTTHVGIETLATSRRIVAWDDVVADLNSEDHALPLVLGTDTSGNAVTADLAKLPHLLVAGQTGSGKSVGLDTIIASLAIGTDPAMVRLHLGDPKRVELSRWEALPHVENPVATSHADIAEQINDLVTIMEHRYELFEEAGVRNVAAYNDLVHEYGNQPTAPKPMPYHVLIIDEMADLLMSASGKVIEADLVRLAQLARAAGIHMVLATQRPIVQVITGNLKANIPSRWAFTVMGTTDSMTILDRADAKKLYGAGDSLALLPGSNEPVRVQAPYVSEHVLEQTIEQVVNTFGEDVDAASDLAASADDEVPEDFKLDDEVLAAAVGRKRAANAEVIGAAFDRTELHGMTNPAAQAILDAGRRKPDEEPGLVKAQADRIAAEDAAINEFKPTDLQSYVEAHEEAVRDMVRRKAVYMPGYVAPEAPAKSRVERFKDRVLLAASAGAVLVVGSGSVAAAVVIFREILAAA